MADSTINGLTALAAASVAPGTDVAPVWQGSASTTKKVTIADLVTAGNTFGTISASSPATISQTWNNAAVTFTGKLISITDTASNASSLLQDWQVGGVKKASITKGGAFYSWNTYTDASNYERASMYWSGNSLYIGSEKAGTGAARAVNIGSNPAGSPDNQLNVQGTTIRLYTATNYVQIDSSSNINPSASTQTVGTSGAPWNGIFLSKTVTAGGTTGAQTINKSSGSVNFAAAATSLVVTNSLVTTSSVIIPSLGTVDATAVLGAVVAGAGSFTINMKTAPTAETRVNFIITN